MTEKRQSSSNVTVAQTKYQSSGLISRFALGQFDKQLVKMLNRVSAQVVLDAGCGEGHILTRFLLDRFQTVYGFDLDIERLHYAANGKAELRLGQGNLEHVPLPDDAVDLVLALEVLEHVGHPEQALHELRRVTRRYVLLSVPNEPFWRIGNMARGAYWSDWGNSPEHINHWSVWGFKKFVSSQFRVLDVATPFLWTFILAEKV